MARKKSQARELRFHTGVKVRVKHGVRDPDFSDIPLGGWSGMIKEVHQAKMETAYLVVWDQTTLRSLHPVYKKRCERDGLEFETMWLGEEDLEADDGTPVPIEQPTEIRTAPLLKKDQDDRVRMALGLTHDDPLPEVSSKALLVYHGYLSGCLAFPFRAKYEKRIGWSERVEMPLTVTGLLRPDECEIEQDYGIIATGRDPEERVDFPLAEIEVKSANASGQLVRDYAYWFHNWR